MRNHSYEELMLKWLLRNHSIHKIALLNHTTIYYNIKPIPKFNNLYHPSNNYKISSI